MNTLPSYRPPFERQHGVVSLGVAALLVFIVVAAIVAILAITGSSISDSASSEQQVAALSLAESGINYAVKTESLNSIPSNSTCTGVGVGSPFSLGRGSFTISGASAPANCSGGSCTGCTITSTGTIGSMSRTLQDTLTLSSKYGVAGQVVGAATSEIDLSLSNSASTSAIALFNAATEMQGANQTLKCTPLGSCIYLWNDQSQNGGGNNSVMQMMAAYTIPGSTGSATIRQFMYDKNGVADSTRNFVEVGALFPATGAVAPAILQTAGFWNDCNGSSGGCNGNRGSTTAQNGTSGSVGNGADLTLATACSNSQLPNSWQPCTKWCYQDSAGYPPNTLVFAFTAHTTTPVSDGLTNVSFGASNTSMGSGPVVHFPGANRDVKGIATPDLFAEFWALQIPSTLPKSYAGTASSTISGAMGATVTGTVGSSYEGSIAKNSTVMTYTSIDFGTAAANDALAAVPNPCSFSGTISAINTVAKTITFSTAANKNCSGAFTFTSKTLTVATVSSGSGTLDVGATISGAGASTTIASGPASGGAGTYTLTSASGPVNAGTITSTSSNLTLSTQISTPPTLYQNDIVSASTISISGSGVVNNTNHTIVYPLTGAGLPLHYAPGSAIPMNRIFLSAVLSSAPPVGQAFAIVQGTGAFAANANTVSDAASSSTTSFRVASLPAPALSGATICDGVCGLFTAGSTSTTPFSFTDKAGSNFRQWAAGFTCISNAGTPIKLFSTSFQNTTWTELVQ